MNGQSLKRPASLLEIARASTTYRDFGYHLKDFLHEFASRRNRGLPLAPMLAAEPPRLAGRFEEGRICDAFLAATADYLSRINRLATPEWSLKEDLVLEQPWFSEEFLEVRLRLLRDTPSPFKDKNLFVFESALSVV